MRRWMCVPMMTLCLLLCGCGGRQERDETDLRAVYQSMSGCTMTAQVTCDQAGLEWSALLQCDYVPAGKSTVEVLEPLELAGVRAVLQEEGWSLEYGDLSLDVGPLSQETISPAVCLARMMQAVREGWLLEQNDEGWDGVPCTRLALEQTGGSGREVITTVWLKQDSGVPLRGEITVDGEMILSAEFTSFKFYDIMNDT